MMGTRTNTKKASIVLLSFVILFCIFEHSWSATYYVDYSSGNDANNGTSRSTPFKHCPGDSAATDNADITLSAGDTVIFKGGVTYTGTGSGALITINASGTSGNYITFRGNTVAEDWGSGKAAINCNNDFYHAFRGNSKDYIKIINFHITNQTQRGGSINTEGGIHADGSDQWLIQNCYIGAVNNYTNICVSPTYTPRNRAIVLNGPLNNIEIDSCIFYASAYQVRLYKSSYVDIHDCDFSGAATPGAHDGHGYMSTALTITRDSHHVNVYDNEFRDGWEYNNDSQPSPVCYGPDWLHIFGGSGGYCHDIIIERNIFYNDHEFKYTTGTAMGFVEPSGGTVDEVTWRNNIFLNPQPSNGALYLKSGIDTMYVYNNLFVIYEHSISSGANGLSVANIGDDSVIKNNIFIYLDTSSTRGYLLKFSDTTFAGTVDYNTYYRPENPGRVVRWGNTPYSFSEWQNASLPVQGQDANGAYGNPYLVDLPADGDEDNCSGGDYRLTTESTNEIDQGDTLSGFSEDYLRIPRPQGSAWDIGPFEYQGIPDDESPDPPSGVIIIQ